MFLNSLIARLIAQFANDVILGLLRPFVFYIRLTLAEKDQLTGGP